MGKINIDIRLATVGSSFIAATTLGGIVVRGRRCDEALEAVQSLLSALGHQGNDDAVLALELTLGGQTVQEMFGPALPSGD